MYHWELGKLKKLHKSACSSYVIININHCYHKQLSFWAAFTCFCPVGESVWTKMLWSCHVDFKPYLPEGLYWEYYSSLVVKNIHWVSVDSPSCISHTSSRHICGHLISLSFMFQQLNTSKYHWISPLLHQPTVDSPHCLAASMASCSAMYSPGG